MPAEIGACLPWLDAEIELIRPAVLVTLGAPAAHALLGPRFRVSQERGRFLTSDLAPHVMATIHPSSILRAHSDPERRAARERFVTELRDVARVLGRA